MDNSAHEQLREAEGLIASGALQQAYALCQAVNARFPAAAEPHLIVAEICLRSGAPARALKAVEAFDARTPGGSARADALRAEVMKRMRRPQEALTAAGRAASRPPLDAQALLMAAAVLNGFGRTEDALYAIRAAAKLDPDAARMHLASTLHVSGELEEAEREYRAAIAANPREVLAWFSLTQLRKNALSEDDITHIRALITTDLPNSEDALLLAHAIAKTQEDAGDFTGALQTLAPYKQAMRVVRNYDFGRDETLFADARATFPGPAGERGRATEAPIFIVGMPRTGTTLVERILSAHPDVQPIGETDLFGVALRTVANATRNAPDMAEVGAEYMRQAAALADGAPHFIDKLPLNSLSAGYIHRALPGARIICLRRGAMDACIANYAQYFSSDVRYGYCFDLADTARYYAKFDELMAHWRAVLPADRFTELHYETLVGHQESETRRLLTFCGLPWDDACLAFNEQSGAVLTASTAQVRQPLYSSSIGRWWKYGAALQPALNVLSEAGIEPEPART